MCGIAGILGRVSERNRGALRRMSDAMIHRGPDAAGSWESTPDGRGFGAMLAFRRLAILDLSPAGNQPMVDPVTGQVIVFNGEIYNYAELRDRLTAEGQAFVSTGDTAVMLRALSLHGHQAVAWLRGMFAFALWDGEQRTLTVARDPLGIKPLYLALSGDTGGGWSLAFASELRALLASGLLGAAKLDPRAAASVLWNGFVVGPVTAVEGVESVWPGQLRVFDATGAEKHAQDFWSVPAARPSSLPVEHHRRKAPAPDPELGRVLEECLRLHLVSDVPLGVFLSSGIDSSAVANLARIAARGPVRTFTLAFEEAGYDEGPDAKRIAEAIGTQHQEVVLTEERFVREVETALASLDQPTFDGLNSFYMSRAVREAGFTVALVGTGGDELFGGYTSFRDLPVFQRWAERLRFLPRRSLVAGAELVAAALTRNAGAFVPQTRWAKLPDMMRSAGDLLSLYQLAYALFLPASQRELASASICGTRDGLPEAMRARLERDTRERSALSAIAVMEQRLFLGERLLRDNDAASMAASIEQRLPLVDRVLFEYVDGLSDAHRFSPVGRKTALRGAGLRGLDPALFDRPKAGFVLPYDRWIRKGLNRVMNGTLRDSSSLRAVGLEPSAVERLWQAFLDGAPGIYWSRVWAIYVLVQWCHRHRVYL